MTDGQFTDKAAREAYWANQRRADRTYVSKTFRYARGSSSDIGQPSRFVSKVFDVDHETEIDLQGDEIVIRTSPQGRIQVKLLIVRSAGRVKQLLVHRVKERANKPPTSEVLLDLAGDDAKRLTELLRNLEWIPIEGEESTRIDDSVLSDLAGDPTAVAAMYERNPALIRALISDDQAAKDVVAIAYRREQVARFRSLLEDDELFDAEAAQRTGPEAVWQHFFEENPWIFGCTLAGQFLTSWSDDRLEQVVSGHSIASTAKRADAVMRTSGRVRSMVFAEIKTHRSPLLDKEYRTGCWSPGEDLRSGVAQVQGTVHLAMDQIGHRLNSLHPDGSEVAGDVTYLFQPRAFLIVGQLAGLTGEAGGDHPDKIRSFELYRRNLTHPEVITFDELLARASWLVEGDAP